MPQSMMFKRDNHVGFRDSVLGLMDKSFHFGGPSKLSLERNFQRIESFLFRGGWRFLFRS